MTSLKDKLLEVINLNGSVSIDHLNSLAKSLNHKESYCERQLRSLRESGLIQRVLKGQVVVAYEKVESQALKDLREIRERHEREKYAEEQRKQFNYTSKLF